MIPIDRKQRLLYALLALFVAAKIFIALQPHAVIWDEAVYSGMGKYIYSAGQSGLWEELRPLGLPLVMGAAWKLGLPAFFNEILMTLFAAGNILLAYLIAKRLFNDTTGLFAALLTAGTAIFFSQSSMFLTEIPSTFFAMLAVYFMLGNRLLPAGGAAAAAAMFKFPHALLIPALLAMPLLELLKTGDFQKMLRDAAKIGVPYVILTGTFLAANFLLYSSSLTDYGAAVEPLRLAIVHQSNPAEAIDGTMANILFYFVVLIEQNVFFAFLPIGIFLVARELRDSGKAQILTAYMTIYLAYFTSIANKQERFALLFLPAAAVFAAHGFYRLLLINKGSSKTSIAGAIIVVTIAVATFFSVAAQDISYAEGRINAELPDYSGYSGVVIASEPLAAHYTDSLVIPYYFSTADKEEGIRKAVERFETHEGQVIFDESHFYCAEQDDYCREQLEIISSRK